MDRGTVAPPRAHRARPALHPAGRHHAWRGRGAHEQGDRAPRRRDRGDG